MMDINPMPISLPGKSKILPLFDDLENVYTVKHTEVLNKGESPTFDYVGCLQAREGVFALFFDDSDWWPDTVQIMGNFKLISLSVSDLADTELEIVSQWVSSGEIIEL